jgi:ATP-dependent DNA helicase DinG
MANEQNPIDLVFGPGGLMAGKFPGYEPRPGQIEYSSNVHAAIEDGRRIMAEGPTGTGKSVGYLVPAIYAVTEKRDEILAWRAALEDEDLADAGFDNGEDRDGNAREPDTTPRVVVVTANIALQEQLMAKDLPLLAEILPWAFKPAIAKGINNYLCLDRFDDSASEMIMSSTLNFEDRQRWNEIAAWKMKTERGDFSELPFEIGGLLRQKVATTSDDCTGKACARFDDCFAQAARRRFRAANVLVTNYHMLFAHLAIASETGTGILPRFDIVILDEVHEAADVAREFFGFTIRKGSFQWATRFLGPKPARAKGGDVGYDLDPELRNRIIDTAEDLFEELRRFRASPKYFARLHDRFPGDWDRLPADLRRAAELLDKTAAIEGARGMPAQRMAELGKARRRCNLLATNLEMGLDPTKDEDGDWAFFIEEEGGDRVSLRAKPVEVNEVLRKKLFEAKAFKSVVATSATLATGTGDDAFEFAVRELGCTTADELIVPSPFDFKRQSLLVIPDKCPNPKAKDFQDRVAEVVCAVIEQAEGRTLGLFTSNAAVRVAAAAVRREFGSKYSIYVQGDAPRSQLIARFRSDVSSVLLGTRSLWAGVDVSGESLSAVVIDKLPFDPPMDPVLDALNEKLGRACFMDYSVPRAAIALRQGFGRLVRSTSDRGVVVICDSRLIDKGFGRKIKAALPRGGFTRDVGVIGEFLRAVEEVA